MKHSSEELYEPQQILLKHKNLNILAQRTCNVINKEILHKGLLLLDVKTGRKCFKNRYFFIIVTFIKGKDEKNAYDEIKVLYYKKYESLHSTATKLLEKINNIGGYFFKHSFFKSPESQKEKMSSFSTNYFLIFYWHWHGNTKVVLGKNY